MFWRIFTTESFPISCLFFCISYEPLLDTCFSYPTFLAGLSPFPLSVFAHQTSSPPGARASSERMERAAEADPSEPNDGTEQRGADPQPPVLSQQQLEICQLHAAMWQREMLTAGFKLRVDAAFIRAAKVTFRAVDAYRQVGFDMAGRIPAAIRQQGTAAVDAYLARRWQPGAFIPARARLAWL